MTVQTDFCDIGFLVAAGDYRNSTITGTTLAGPSGSGQFCLMEITTSLTIGLTTTGSTQPIVGVLQNKPATGIACDLKFLGISKVVCGSTATAIVPGTWLAASTLAGAVCAYTSTASFVGYSLEAPSTLGTVFAAFLQLPGTRISTA